MQYTGASHFVWQGYTGSDLNYRLPKGELVIVRTYDDDSSVCLAWKFNIYADEPAMRLFIYVNAWTGKVVLDDPIIKHANTNGTADTRYSGTQTITGKTTLLQGATSRQTNFPTMIITGLLRNTII